MQVLRFYVRPGPPERVGGPGEGSGGAPPGLGLGSPLRVARAVEPGVTAVTCELCYYLAWDGETPPSAEEGRILRWLLGSPLGEGEEVAPQSFLRPHGPHVLLEIGPRLGVSTAASTNAVSLCRAAGLCRVRRLERSRRLLLQFEGQPPAGAAGRLGRALRDPMTEQLYPEPLVTFEVPVRPVPVTTIDVLRGGPQALEKADHELGLAFDPWDVQYYTRLFRAAGRNPTSVECFDLAQSNSEHSRHWFFKGRLVVDGQEKPQSLFQSIMGTQSSSNPNNVIKFSDNSSAIRGVPVTALWPRDPAEPSPFEKRTTIRHVIFTAETHNFPTAVAPFSGATTGTGGRIRDVQCTGRGAHVIAGTAGYSFGNLLIPGYDLPWEDGAQPYPKSFARPLEIAIGASDGASDYGNKFGEPVLAGFARSFGQVLPGGQRREWIKPIMFSGGIGAIEDDHVRKEPPEPGMLVVKVGGPVYRIGVGGGAASSIQVRGSQGGPYVFWGGGVCVCLHGVCPPPAPCPQVQGDNAEERDAGAVQRGDPEMEQKMNRVLRGCIESGGGNPICSIHDQGAGGNGNVLKELSEPAGAVIYASRFQRGDPTLSVLELWGAEYQESNALLVRPPRVGLLRRLAARERCPLCVVGTITGDGRIVLVDDLEAPVPEGGSHEGLPTPVNLELEWVLGKMPRKEFMLQRVPPTLRPLALPPALSVRQALERVLRLPAVASKRYLTNKVDRSVTGLVAQQQCVGPLHTPLADVAVVALSHFDTVGAATALGEQPIKGLLDPAAGARLALTEALTNLVFARITDLRDVKCSGNWMWGAKTGAEGGALVTACEGLVGLLHRLGVAIDGGKDSLSMAARVGTETVLAPGTLVVSAYAVCPDITATVTPDLKCPDGKGALLWVQLSPGRHRLGGSALAQVFSQLGDACPDLEDPEVLAAAFRVTQRLIEERALRGGHDVSDGGLLGCLLEMAFAGNCGLQVDVAAVPPDASRSGGGGRHDRAVRARWGPAGALGGDQFPTGAGAGGRGLRGPGGGWAAPAPGTYFHPHLRPLRGAPPAPAHGATRAAGGRPAGGRQQRGPRDGGRLRHGRLPGVGRDDGGPLLGHRHPRRLPGARLRGGVQLRRRPRLRQGLGSRRPLPPAGAGRPGTLPPAPRHLQPRRLQRVPAPGPAGLGGTTHGPVPVPDSRGNNGGAGGGPGPPSLRGRRGAPHGRVPPQPQRLGGGGGRPLLPLRPPFGRHAPPRAGGPRLAVALVAPALGAPHGAGRGAQRPRRSLAPHVPQRLRVVLALAPRRGLSCPTAEPPPPSPTCVPSPTSDSSG
ncbi:phosphoribosylformylglycinamidine synthase isoform 5-T5 [Morphnus guianensis]